MADVGQGSRTLTLIRSNPLKQITLYRQCSVARPIKSSHLRPLACDYLGNLKSLFTQRNANIRVGLQLSLEVRWDGF